MQDMSLYQCSRSANLDSEECFKPSEVVVMSVSKIKINRFEFISKNFAFVLLMIGSVKKCLS